MSNQIVINNLHLTINGPVTINQWPRQAAIVTVPTLPEARTDYLYPWWTLDPELVERAEQAQRDRQENDNESSGYL